MPDKVLPGPIHGNAPCVREAVCIHTNRIYDSCRDKECIEDLRIYPTRGSQELIDQASAVKPKSAELIWTQIDVSEVSFNRGFFAVDIKFYYRVTSDVSPCAGRPQEAVGLAIYQKRVILFGSDGNVRIFNSKDASNCCPDPFNNQSNMPTAVVEAVDPIVLCAKLVDASQCPCTCDDLCDVPACVACHFSDEIVSGGDTKRIYITLGQFSIVRLERETQLLMPSYDFCVPDKECVDSGDCVSPCDLFRKIKFPVDQFFPPAAAMADEESGGKCGCK